MTAFWPSRIHHPANVCGRDLRQRDFWLLPMLLSIGLSRIVLVLLRSRSDRRLNDPLDLSSRVFTITHEPLDQVPAAIKDKRLRNTLIVAQVIIYQFVFGKAHWILNAKLFRIGGNLRAIVFPT